MAEIYGYVFYDGNKQAYYAEKAKKLKAAIEDKMTVMVDGKRQYLEGIGGVEKSQRRWISEDNYKNPFLIQRLYSCRMSSGTKKLIFSCMMEKRVIRP